MTVWTSTDIAAATGGTASAPFETVGVAFDSREVGPGDLFVAMKGEATDGHHFLTQAFAQGAAGAIVSEPTDHPHVRVRDSFDALQDLGRAARARSEAAIIGVTGSVGKTSAKEALFAALDRGWRGRVHRSVKSYNNHTGVPLSLARMPQGMRAGVFEMGMNHAGELAALTRIVRPHIAIVTAIAPAHTAFFSGEEAIADAKGEIFQGLEPGGVAIVPHDSPHRDRLIVAAQPHAARIVTFGFDKGADVRAIESMRAATGGSFVTARVGERELSFTLSQPGAHWVSNALAVLAAVDAAGGDLGQAGLALAELGGLAGRGARFIAPLADGQTALVIDESYNANPASMRATLAVLAHEPGRHVAVLGEMRELGDASDDYHAALAEPILAARVEMALLVGEAMAPLGRALEGRVDFVHVADARAAQAVLADRLAPGDAVLVKGSNGVGLSRVVAALRGGT
ncbi:UDP-N-acetylmuramoyl-tripeptide--D-alanyl-D-alanine ligase [Sphingomonas carotinifaciens]|uniref:UDP-N-acetylmuramoyl-tripeptide--D-alanyl-D-alanine ligase n=1 Tax=Sphingomonas carotinifaciens TaxID=1166323 RepID=A0A1G7JBI3_9SPHN|nr:UDP-N-acetylmuramoyl-tripeptide--D-alanyl-D-alanine ligase [Sphingomonas carotinifaciens]MBB4084568.1 UDP-N-acetylmuramoyl-tripeptide--D-alanyl-D-alanine ligase [Sphingomonas carotinifaciens]MWC43959.1 UDP-N-acetylmuramoyl-tripeptide--D-alanyl-D-alanine ligase [Sphingomonas carotinifaciens]SDF21829.1 UDP-N-acetylmuramoyl-tripeptide--D-alanyl-D-alanine ligase [Sphingomonas carotinifaciens]